VHRGVRLKRRTTCCNELELIELRM
jgi:hypothetical protein